MICIVAAGSGTNSMQKQEKQRRRQGEKREVKTKGRRSKSSTEEKEGSPRRARQQRYWELKGLKTAMTVYVHEEVLINCKV